MAAGHSHGHSHGSVPPGPNQTSAAGQHQTRLLIVLGLSTTYLIIEVVGGLLTNSLALLADAGHMLTDVGAIALSLLTGWIAQRPANDTKTYGYLRWEILAAFLNGGTLLLISAWIVWEALLRMRTPEPVGSSLMLGVAVVGLVVNIFSAWILHGSRHESLNVRGAYLHVLGDLLGSVGTVAAAVIVKTTGWLTADPVISLLTTMLIVRGAWRLVKESVDVLLESTPAHIPMAAVREQLQAIPGVESVHDLHVWTVTSGVIAMSAHAIVRDASRQQHVLEHIHDAMKLFGIGHVTVQLESSEMYEREVHLHP